MQYIEAPHSYSQQVLPKSVYLAGGITNCPDWQQQMVHLFCHTDYTLLNPRRKCFPISGSQRIDRANNVGIPCSSRCKRNSVLVSVRNSLSNCPLRIRCVVNDRKTHVCRCPPPVRAAYRCRNSDLTGSSRSKNCLLSGGSC